MQYLSLCFCLACFQCMKFFSATANLKNVKYKYMYWFKDKMQSITYYNVLIRFGRNDRECSVLKRL